MTLLVGCMMAMNAEDLLPVSLGSLLKSVDTAIVVDGGSTDATRTLAKSMGAEVVDSPWPSHNAQPTRSSGRFTSTRHSSDPATETTSG